MEGAASRSWAQRCSNPHPPSDWEPYCPATHNHHVATLSVQTSVAKAPTGARCQALGCRKSAYGTCPPETQGKQLAGLCTKHGSPGLCQPIPPPTPIPSPCLTVERWGAQRGAKEEKVKAVGLQTRCGLAGREHTQLPSRSWKFNAARH